jgi:hypothetical protein
LLWVYALTVTGILFDVSMNQQFSRSSTLTYNMMEYIHHECSHGDGPSIQSGASLRRLGLIDRPCNSTDNNHYNCMRIITQQEIVPLVNILRLGKVWKMHCYANRFSSYSCLLLRGVWARIDIMTIHVPTKRKSKGIRHY